MNKTMDQRLIRKYTDHPDRMPPEALTLEITEHAMMANPMEAIAVLRELDVMGVRLSIDDYGTGFSSLAYLKQLPVDELKIDKSFVMRMHENPNDEIIVRSTIDLAHNLGLKVTAEGVEQEAALALLESLRCDMAQGYLYSKPLGSEGIGTLLARGTSSGVHESQSRLWENIVGRSRRSTSAMMVFCASAGRSPSRSSSRVFNSSGEMSPTAPI